MTRLAACGVLVAVACLALGRASSADVTMKGDRLVVHPTQTNEVLINPGVGWQLLVTADPAGEMERLPLCSTYYYRTSWTAFEPERGRYADSPAIRRFDLWLAEARKHGRYVALRVVPWNSRNPSYQRDSAQKVQGCDSPVPAYIFDEGAQGFPEPGDSGGWVPVFWDPVYAKYHQKIAEFLGKRYGGDPNVAYIDIPGGNYGEWNLTNTGVPTLDDLSVWRQHGLTKEAWQHTVEHFCDMYRAAFPHDLLVAAKGYVLYPGGPEAIPHQLKLGVGFRDDGLGMDYCGPGQTNAEYEQRWKQVLCLYENGGGSWLNFGDEARVRAVLEWAIDQTHASIVMVGKWDRGVRAYERHLPLVKELGKRVGFRLVVQEAEWPASVKPGAALPISLTWGNLGNAPPYVNFALQAMLLDAKGESVALTTVGPEALRTATWLPGATPKTEVKLNVPKDLAAGRYRVAVALYEPTGAKPTPLAVRRPLRLGIEGGDEQARYLLAEVTVK